MTRRRNPYDLDPRLLAADGARYFSDEALSEADRESAPSKSRTALVLMHPKDFLKMAEPGKREESQAALERVLDAGTRLSDVPRLFIDVDRKNPTRAVVTGHEGRHRSRALLARGVTQMPVRLHAQTIRWGEQANPKSWDYLPELPNVLLGEGSHRENVIDMPVPLHHPEIAERLPRRRNPRRRNPEPTVEVYRDRQGEVSGVKVRLGGGEVSAVRPDPAEREMYVGWSELPESARGKGLGVQMYAALMDWALENDFILTSDETVSREAGRVWEALARRGYPIRKHPEARTITEGGIGAWYAHGRKPPFLLHRRNPAQTDTPTSSAAFRRWFGASKVVDAEGNPLIVYHGTTAVFDVFDFHAGIGAPVPNSVYFTDSPDLATYVSRMGWGKPPVVIAAYLRMENPLVLDAKGKHAIDMTDEVLRKLRPSYRSNAHDGVILLNVREFQQDALTTTYAVLEPTQIKAVDAGTFDPADPNFRHNPRPTTAERTDPALWEAVKREVTAGSKGGVRGEWSARKAQLAVALYKKRGGGYLGPKSPRNALAKWTQEDWRTRSGEPSLVTGERYLPARAIEALTPAEYAATTRVKRAGLRRDEQFTAQPERIREKTARYRRNPEYVPLRWEDGDDEDDLDFEASGHLTDAVSAVLHGMELTGQGKPSASEVSSLWQREGVFPHARALYLHDVTVSPGLRGRGAGRRYVAKVEDDVRRQGAEVVVLHADHSLAFWQKQGYTLWSHPPAKRPELSAVMYKVLARANPARRAGDKRYRRNPIRPHEAEAIRAIRENLTPDLLTSKYRACATRSPVAGHCAVATEALYFTLGGKAAGYTPMNVRHEGVSPWYLRTPDGRYLDPTADQFDTPVDYASGRGRGFPTPRQGRAEPPPSKRAATLLQRLGERHRR